jgi:hypothetical protein
MFDLGRTIVHYRRVRHTTLIDFEEQSSPFAAFHLCSLGYNNELVAFSYFCFKISILQENGGKTTASVV